MKRKPPTENQGARRKKRARVTEEATPSIPATDTQPPSVSNKKLPHDQSALLGHLVNILCHSSYAIPSAAVKAAYKGRKLFEKSDLEALIATKAGEMALTLQDGWQEKLKGVITQLEARKSEGLPINQTTLLGHLVKILHDPNHAIPHTAVNAVSNGRNLFERSDLEALIATKATEKKLTLQDGWQEKLKGIITQLEARKSEVLKTNQTTLLGHLVNILHDPNHAIPPAAVRRGRNLFERSDLEALIATKAGEMALTLQDGWQEKLKGIITQLEARKSEGLPINQNALLGQLVKILHDPNHAIPPAAVKAVRQHGKNLFERIDLEALIATKAGEMELTLPAGWQEALKGVITTLEARKSEVLTPDQSALLGQLVNILHDPNHAIPPAAVKAAYKGRKLFERIDLEACIEARAGEMKLTLPAGWQEALKGVITTLEGNRKRKTDDEGQRPNSSRKRRRVAEPAPTVPTAISASSSDKDELELALESLPPEIFLEREDTGIEANTIYTSFFSEDEPAFDLDLVPQILEAMETESASHSITDTEPQNDPQAESRINGAVPPPASPGTSWVEMVNRASRSTPTTPSLP